MSSINMSIRTDSELKAQAELVLSQLGMNMTGAINMFLRQIVRDRAVPLSLSLSSEQSLYADLLRAKAEREQGVEGVPASQLLADMDRIIKETESGVEIEGRCRALCSYHAAAAHCFHCKGKRPCRKTVPGGVCRGAQGTIRKPVSISSIRGPESSRGRL